ncbi:MAG: hypothetical protein KGJ86_08885 [Chloroflexota bacterium]|nr:hypothetical protein [Chloroflexota bacterium]
MLCLVVVPGWRKGVAGLIREVAFVISRRAPHFRRFTVYRRIVTTPGYPSEGPWAA